MYFKVTITSRTPWEFSSDYHTQTFYTKAETIEDVATANRGYSEPDYQQYEPVIEEVTKDEYDVNRYDALPF